MYTKRADKIVEWALETGRHPTDTAGMDSDDEEWLGAHPYMGDYISEEFEQRRDKEDESEEEDEEDVDPVDSLLDSLMVMIVSPNQNLQKYKGSTDRERLKKYVDTFNSGQATPTNLKEAVTRIRGERFKQETKDTLKEFKLKSGKPQVEAVIQKALGFIKVLGPKAARTKKKKPKKNKKSKSMRKGVKRRVKRNTVP